MTTNLRLLLHVVCYNTAWRQHIDDCWLHRRLFLSFAMWFLTKPVRGIKRFHVDTWKGPTFKYECVTVSYDCLKQSQTKQDTKRKAETKHSAKGQKLTLTLSNQDYLLGDCHKRRKKNEDHIVAEGRRLCETGTEPQRLLIVQSG